MRVWVVLQLQLLYANLNSLLCGKLVTVAKSVFLKESAQWKFVLIPFWVFLWLIVVTITFSNKKNVTRKACNFLYYGYEKHVLTFKFQVFFGLSQSLVSVLCF